MSAPEMIATLVGVPAIMTLAGLLLATADTIRQQVKAGQPVGIVPRVLFGAGIWSLLFWVIATLLAGFPLAIWLGNMTWERAAG